MAKVILSASVERFSVSRMRDLLSTFANPPPPGCPNSLVLKLVIFYLFFCLLLFGFALNPSWTGLTELRPGGWADLPYHYKILKSGGKPFFLSLQLFAVHQNNNCQGWCCKRKVPKKKVTAEKP